LALYHPHRNQENDVNDTHHGRITKDGIRIYEPTDYAGMHASGQVAAQILDEVGALVQPGATTGEIDAFVERRVVELGTTSATIGYKGYAHASCISVNHVVCHGIPGSKIPGRKNDVLLEGDIVNIDITVIKDGWFGDTSRMYVAGKAKKFAERLITVTHDALMFGIDAVKPGNTFDDIASAIQTHAHKNRMSVVRDFCGHGIGRVFHSPPNVLHYVPARRAGETAPVLEEGMIFTIEPMINMGRPETKVLKDDWTAITVDKKLTAQFEHSIVVTATGSEIFTLSPGDMYFPKF